MMKRFMLIGLMVMIAATLAATPAIAADKVRGVTDKEIRIGQWGPQTGPAALWGAVARGTDLYFKMINDEGGIHGRKIKYYLRDDGYNPAKTKAIAKEFVDRLGVFAVVGGVGTGPGMAVRDYLSEKKMPWIGPSTGSTLFTRPFNKYIFGVYPHYPDEAYLLTKYAYENKGKKIAFFYQNDEYGKGGLEGVEKAMKELGAELVASVSVEVPDTDLSSHALKLKASGADVVITWLLPKHAAIILGECAKIGFKPQWVSTNTLSDAPIMFKITKGLWAGVIISMFGDLPTEDTPLNMKYKAAQQKFAPKERWGTFYAAGIIWAEPLVEAMKRVGPDLNEEKLIAALETFDNWRGVGPPLTFTDKEHQGAKAVKVAEVDDKGNLVLLSDWLKITE